MDKNTQNNINNILEEAVNFLLDSVDLYVAPSVDNKGENLESVLNYVESHKDDLTDAQRNTYNEFKENLANKKEEHANRVRTKSVSMEELEKANRVRFTDWNAQALRRKKFVVSTIALSLAGVITLTAMGPKAGTTGSTRSTVQAAAVKTDDGKSEEFVKAKDLEDKTIKIKEDYLEQYANFINYEASFLTSGLQNGIKGDATSGLHDILIANITSLTEDQEILLASESSQVVVQDWFTFSSRLADDMADVTLSTLPFDANHLFINDREAATDLNNLMDLCARINENPTDENLLNEYKAYYDDYIANLDTKRSSNPAAAEAILNIASQMAQPGMGIRTNLSDEELFDGENSLLASVRVELENTLKVDHMLLETDNEKAYDAIINTDTLTKYDIAGLKENPNKALQLKFTANVEAISHNQAQNLADKLELNGTKKEWSEFSDALAKGIVDGSITDFDFNDLFSNPEDAQNLETVQTIFNNFKENGDKDALSSEFADFYFNYSMRLENRLTENNAATDLLMNILHESQTAEAGLKVGDDLYKILVGEGLTPECKLSDVTIDETGQEVANRNFWQEARAEINSRTTSVLIHDEIVSNRDAAGSIYQEAVLKHRQDVMDNVSKGGANPAQVVKEAVAEKIKDVVFVPNADREALYAGRLGVFSDGGYTDGGMGAGGSGSGAGSSESEVSYTGSGSESNGSEVWTQEQVDQANEDNKITEDEEVNRDFEALEEEQVIEENTVVEDLELTDEQKEENQDAADSEDISQEEADKLTEDKEHFDNKDKDGNAMHWDISYTVDDMDKWLAAGLIDEDLYNTIYDKGITQSLFDAIKNGTVSQKDYDEYHNNLDLAEKEKVVSQEENNSDETAQDANEKEDSQKEETNENTNINPPEEGEKSLEQLLAEGAISEEEYNIIKNNEVAVEGDDNISFPPAGDKKEMDGVLYESDGKGGWFQVDENAKDEIISSETEKTDEVVVDTDYQEMEDDRVEEKIEEYSAPTQAISAPEVEAPVVEAETQAAPEVEAPVAEAETQAAPVVEAPVAEAETQAAPEVEAPVVEAETQAAPVVEAPVAEAPAPSIEEQIAELTAVRESLNETIAYENEGSYVR